METRDTFNRFQNKLLLCFYVFRLNVDFVQDTYFCRVAGNKKAGPNYGDINRCKQFDKKKDLIFSFPFDIRHDNKPVRRGARQDAGKKGDFFLGTNISTNWLSICVKFD